MRNSQRRTRPRLLGASLGAGVLVAALLAAPQAAQAAGALTDMTGGGPMGSTAYATVPTMAGTVTTIGATFNTSNSACSATYPTTFSATLVAATTTTKLSSTTVSFVVPTALSLTSGNRTTYYVCLYNGTSGTTALLNTSVGTDPTPFQVTPVATIAPATGPSGGGNTITVTAPAASTTLFSSVNAPYVAFTTATTGCGQVANDTAPANIPTNVVDNARVSDTQMKVTVPPIIGGVGTTNYAVCVYDQSGGSGTLIATAGTYSTNPPPTVSLNSTVGPLSSTITMTGPANFLTGITPVGQVRSTAAATATLRNCAATYTTTSSVNPADATAVRKISNNKVAFTMPAAATIADGPSYNLCLYASNSTTTGSEGKLLATAQYTVATPPEVTIVSPVSGSPLGGSTITITGTSLPTSLSSITSATLGGIPLNNVTPISPTTLTAVVPPNSLGSKTLSLTTAAGVASLTGAYTYVNSISVTPNTSTNTATAVDLDVAGSGFNDLVFGNASTNVGAHVYLVGGTWRSTASASDVRDNVNAVADCLSVLVINDTELVCTVNLTRALRSTGALAVVADGWRDVAATGAVLVSGSRVLKVPAGAFTKADIGKAVAAYTAVPAVDTTSIPASTTIVEVLNDTTVIISQDGAGTAATTGTIQIGTKRTSLTAAAASGDTVLTAAASTFSSADVGRYVTGTNVAADTYITGVNDAGSMVVLSKAVSGAVTAVTAQSSNAVPVGSYNVVVVSDADPDNASTTSVYSSGSTFTVAPF